jgi:DNA-binding NarL/FixJ family response regulator
MSSLYRVVIADDHKLVVQGLRALLIGLPNVKIVGEAENGLEAIKCVGETDPDLLLIDLTMPGMNGIEAIGEVKARYPSVKILVLTVHAEEEFVDACLRAGVNGYVVKDASQESFLTAVSNVLEGHTYLCSVATEKLIGRLVATVGVTQPTSPIHLLTLRERQVLQLIAEGQTNKEAGRFLSLSPKTVERHRAIMMAKLNLHSTAELTAFAFRSGLARRWSSAKSFGVSAFLCVGDWLEFAAGAAFI